MGLEGFLWLSLRAAMYAVTYKEEKGEEEDQRLNCQ
jgi:hypothetical protein